MIKKTLYFILLFMLFSASTYSETQKLYSYPPEALFLSAFKFLTLEKNFEVTKENPEIGLLIFTYRDGAMLDKKASVEIVRNARGENSHRLRLQIPSVSEGTITLLLEELHQRIEKDFSSPKMNEKIFEYDFERLSSSIYRYLEVNADFDIKEFNKEKGIIYFKGSKSSKSAKSWCEIFAFPTGGFKVRLVIPNLASSTISTYLEGIKEKLKSDYDKDI